MGAIVKRTQATDLAFDRVAALIAAEKIDYPSKAVFIPSDLPDFGSRLSRALLRDMPIVVVYPDGRERLIQPTVSPGKTPV